MATPSRRSRRSQPAVPTSLLKPSNISSKDVWLGDPIASDATRVSDDIPADYELDTEKSWETRYFKSFHREKGAVKGKGKAKAVDMMEDDPDFSVGDTVIVRGFFKETHVGVIAALWEVRCRDEVEDEDEDEEQATKMVLLHWFLKPKELPKTGASRDHRDGEIYYTIDQTAVLSTASILTHCDVTSAAKYTKDGDDDGGKHWKYGSDTFFCDTAFQNGLHFDFDWEKLCHFATESSLKRPQDAREHWNVAIKGAKRSKGESGRKKSARRDQKPTKSPQKEAQRTPSKSAARARKTEAQDLNDEDIEDEDGAASDEYERPDDDESSSDDEMEVEPVSDEGENTASSGAEDVVDLRTPPKKRKRPTSTPRTPQSKRQKKTKAVPTPASRAALAARKTSKKGKLRVAHPSTYETAIADKEALERIPKDAHLRAMHLLHVAARPDALPGRDTEFTEVLGSVLNVLEEGTGGCIYICGVPGTGKTATVHAVVRELQKMATNNETNPFTYVEINGLRLPEPSAAYSVLWEAVAGHDVSSEGHLKISAKEALKKLDRYFGGGRTGPAGGAFVVLMDELDQLVTAKQDVVYNFFNWPNLPNSRLVVIAVSNTHDLPERVMSAKVKSRLGMEMIQFNPYKRDQLVEIVNSRLQASREGLKVDANVIHEDAVKYASARVAAVNGDARRVLDIARRAVETVYNPKGKSKIVQMAEITAVIKAMQNSPTAAYLKDCSFIERVALAAVLKCVRREGVDEVKWGDVAQQCLILFEQLRDDMGMTRPSQDRLRFVLQSLVSSKAVLLEPIEKKPMHERRVKMNLETGEVVRGLSDAGGTKWENVLGA